MSAMGEIERGVLGVVSILVGVPVALLLTGLVCEKVGWPKDERTLSVLLSGVCFVMGLTIGFAFDMGLLWVFMCAVVIFSAWISVGIGRNGREL